MNPKIIRNFVVQHRGVEQLVARRAHNPEVRGSSPLPATKQDKSQDLSFFVSSHPRQKRAEARFWRKTGSFLRFDNPL